MRNALKASVERALGVKIYRTPPSKHFYPHLAKMRRWSSEDVIFDVGANDGRTVVALQDLLPSPRIFAFEPTSKPLRKLQAQAARFPNVTVFPYAMGAEIGKADIHIHDESVMNSFVTVPATPGRTESVEVRTVDSMMRELGIDFVHFLKIDTEGFESEVLRGAADALAGAKIGIVQAEFHISEQEGLQRIHERLAPYGYELFGFFNQNPRPVHPVPEWQHGEAAGFERKALEYADAVYAYTGRTSDGSVAPLR